MAYLMLNERHWAKIPSRRVPRKVDSRRDRKFCHQQSNRSSKSMMNMGAMAGHKTNVHDARTKLLMSAHIKRVEILQERRAEGK